MKTSERNLSRRSFFGTSAMVTLAAGPTAPSAGAAPERISDNLHRFEDTCHVYVIRDGNRATLIDFGSGAILSHLAKLGISGVDGILHTHHHRDQCQGDHLAVERKIPIAVPAYEHHLFTDVENFWRNRRVFHEGYETRNDYFTLASSIPGAARLQDYETFHLGRRDFYVLPAPGHTLGSVTLLTEIDGRKVAFTGDLLHSPGKLLTLHDLQHQYGGNEGVDFTIYSLSKLRDRHPDTLCPSHGIPMTDAPATLDETIATLSEYYRFVTGGNTPTIENVPYAVSPHLIAADKTACSFYVILSDSGKAMFIDYGFPSGDFSEQFVKATEVNSRCRFVEHNLDALKNRFGMKSIDVAMPTHTNDDHYCGFPYLKRHHGTRIWCYSNMVDILQNPRGNRLGCILAEPIPVDRSFRHGETFRWEEFEFTIVHNPGHAEYQMALFATIDGKRVAFTGDNYSIPIDRPLPDGSMRIRPVCLNHFVSDSYQKAIRALVDYRPDLIAPGHGRASAVTGQMLLATRKAIDKRAGYYKKLIADPDCDFGMDATWIKLYPYQMVVATGGSVPAEVRVRNYRSVPMKLKVALRLPAGWRAEPGVLRFETPPKSDAACKFRLFAGPARTPRLAITAGVTVNGKHLGEIAEAVVNVAGKTGD